MNNEEKLISNVETINSLCEMFENVVSMALNGKVCKEVKEAYQLFALELYVREIIPLSYFKFATQYLTPDIHLMYLREGFYEN